MLRTPPELIADLSLPPGALSKLPPLRADLLYTLTIRRRPCLRPARGRHPCNCSVSRLQLMH